MLNRRQFLATSIAAAASSAPLSQLAFAEGPRLNGPGRGPWELVDPKEVGLSKTALQKAADKLAEQGERQGIVVIRHGKLAFEQYWANEYARAVPEWQNVSFSSGKSWGSTMVGRAVTEGKLSVDDLASKYHPSEVSGLKPNTTIKHLLTMSSGGTMNMKPSSVRPKKLTDNSPPGLGAEYEWYKEAEKGTPPGYGISIEPGTQFFYDGAPADHLANIIAAAVGKSSHRYMIEDVVTPLGCENFSYQPEGVDKNDNVRFGGSILISCRDMARLGQLYLNAGVWDGKQLIAESYIRQATTSSALNHGYGYLWWLNYTRRIKAAPTTMYFAAGARGQFCFTLPEHDMVIATMGFGKESLSTDEAWEVLAPILPNI